MASEQYLELLKDPRWQRKRLEKLQSANWRCENCFDGTKCLNVHHLEYKRGAMPWEYELRELQVLCEKCHKRTHEMQEELLHFVKCLGAPLTCAIYGYAAALNSGYKQLVTGEEIPVDVRDWQVAKGVSDAIGTSTCDGQEFGGQEWVHESADENGMVLPHVLHRRITSAWSEAWERKRSGRNPPEKE